MEEAVYHVPALLQPTIDGLNIEPAGIYVDVTLGGGGHTRAILSRLDPDGHLYSLDQDRDAIARVQPSEKFTPIHGNFRHLANYMDYYGVLGRVDGILADLGVSSHHFDEAARGFSFRADGPLDMRMNPQATRTAADLLASIDLDGLTDLLRLYGELPQARRVAKALIDARSQAPVDTTTRLTDLVRPFLSLRKEKKELAQVYQALRIAVNGEMEALESFLSQAMETLRPGGRLAVITYHSLEDRMVKNFMRTGRIDGRDERDIFGRSFAPMKPLTSKPVVPDDAEIESNPRSRSAKLRVAVKL